MIIGTNQSYEQEQAAKNLDSTEQDTSQRLSALNQLTETSTEIVKVLDKTEDNNNEFQIKPEDDISFSQQQQPEVENNNSNVMIASPDVS